MCWPFNKVTHSKVLHRNEHTIWHQATQRHTQAIFYYFWCVLLIIVAILPATTSYSLVVFYLFSLVRDDPLTIPFISLHFLLFPLPIMFFPRLSAFNLSLSIMHSEVESQPTPPLPCSPVFIHPSKLIKDMAFSHNSMRRYCDQNGNKKMKLGHILFDSPNIFATLL